MVGGLISSYLPGLETLGQETFIKIGPELENLAESWKKQRRQSPHREALVSMQDSNRRQPPRKMCPQK